MDNNTDTLTISDNPTASRFETHLGDCVAVAEYRRSGDTIMFTHTEVPPQFRGRGVAEKLVRYALDQARAQNLRVVPACAYVAAFIRRHPEYQALVATAR